MRFTQIGKTWVVLISRFGFLCLLASCAQHANTDQWDSPLYQNHSLVGKIWQSEQGSFVDEAELQHALANASYVLLGEKHDNPDHHQLQLHVLRSLLENSPALVTFEMLDSTADQKLLALPQQRFASAEEIRSYLDWDEEGWDWQFYGPLLEAVYRAGMPVRSGNISAETVGRVYAEPEPAHLAEVLGESVMEKLFEDIDASHCGLLPASQFPAMVRVQQSRDDRMARQLASGTDNELAVLIAGNYHVRQDLGVPNYLLAHNETLLRDEIVSLAFLEVQPGENDAAAYLEQFTAVPAFDYIWFTPAVTAEDYCDSLR